MKQRHPVILTAAPVAFPELVRVRIQILDDEQKYVVQERNWTPLLPWSKLEKLPLQPGVREASEQLLREGREAPLGTHLLSLELYDCLTAAGSFEKK